MSGADDPAALETAIARYNDAWNAHDLDAIMAMHAPDMVFENHTAHERAEGEAITWDGIDVIPFEDGLVKRKDVYSDSVAILGALGLL
jgi:ketosteroid isomerase-like protein